MVKVWDLVTQKCLATLEGHQDQIVKVQWLNMGLQFATASVDGVVKLWNLKKQQCVNTFEMHADRIWCMDLYEVLEKNEDKGDEDDVEYKSTVNMITGGCDSTLKIWQDVTVEQEHEDKEAQLKRIQDEQKLSHLIRKEDFIEAAMLAFKMNKLRDFYHVLLKVMRSEDKGD